MKILGPGWCVYESQVGKAMKAKFSKKARRNRIPQENLKVMLSSLKGHNLSLVREVQKEVIES